MPARLALLLVAFVASAGGLAATGALDTHSSPAAPRLEPGVPVEVSVEELRDLVGSRAAPVYWAGPRSTLRLELTRTTSATFIRYLSKSARVGDQRPLHLTVGTYRMSDAYSVAARAGRAPDAVTRRAPGGGLVVWRTGRPTSVYLVYQGSDRLVEVFDPRPRRAQSLALSGGIRAVRGG